MREKFFHYARHQTLALDTISRKKNSLNTIDRKKKKQETFENKIETILSGIDWTQTARARKKNFLNYCDLQETFDNKIGTIVSEIDWTHTARARKFFSIILTYKGLSRKK